MGKKAVAYELYCIKARALASRALLNYNGATVGAVEVHMIDRSGRFNYRQFDIELSGGLVIIARHYGDEQFSQRVYTRAANGVVRAISQNEALLIREAFEILDSPILGEVNALLNSAVEASESLAA